MATHRPRAKVSARIHACRAGATVRRRSRPARLLSPFALLLALALALAGLPWLLPTGAVAAATTTRTVTKLADTNDGVCDADCSLREAIAIAASGDTVAFGALTGQIDLNLGALTVNKSLKFTGPGPTALVVSGRNATRVFVVDGAGIGVTLSGLTIANGRGLSGYGGGLRQVSGTLTLENVVVRDNVAVGAGGGGIYIGGGTLTLKNSTIRNNQSAYESNYGGGGAGLYIDDAYSAATVGLYDSVVRNNATAVVGANGGDGGGINVTHRAGLNNPYLYIYTTTISDNDAPKGYGGGLASNGANVTIADSTLARNTADYGGGLSYKGNSLTLQTSTLSGNTVAYSGAALYSSIGPANLSYLTVVGNLANTSNTVGEGGALSGGVVKSSIVAGNRRGTGGSATASDCVSVGSGGYNVVGATGFCPTNGPGDLAYSGALDGLVNPTLADNGGPTPTHLLALTSPAVDRLSAALCTAVKDQRQVSRPKGNGCDSGAVEQQAFTLTASSVGPGNIGTAAGTFTLKEGTVSTFVAQSDAGASFVGWTVDGQPAGRVNPLQVTISGNRTVVATFALPSASPSPSPSGPAPSFADVPAGYWAHDQIVMFAQRGITTGCGDNDQGQRLYCPERGVTRAEMATFLVRALGRQNQPPPVTPTFADVPTDYWAYSAIEAFVKLGITTGCGTDDLGRRVYCPDRGVTRAEMAAFLDRAKGQTELTSGNPTFADVPASYWAYGWIERFFTLGVTTGCGTDDGGNKVYCPDRGVTRTEMAVFIIRAYP